MKTLGKVAMTPTAERVGRLEQAIEGLQVALGRVQLDVAVICASVTGDPRKCRTTGAPDSRP